MTTTTHQKSTRCRGRGLFLETSAQIDRFLACEPIRKDIRRLCAKFDRVGTSAFVAAEFDEVVGKFMLAAQEALCCVPNPDKRREFSDIWLEVGQALPFKYRGKSLATQFALHMARRHKEPLTPNFLINTIRSQWEILQTAFYRVGKWDMRQCHTVFDGTTCCLWKREEEPACVHPKAHVGCRLGETCWKNRQVFESAVRMLSNKRVSERRALTEALEKLVKCQDSFEYLSTVTAVPNAFGDILIFFEVPDGWSLLTKDHAYEFLNEHHGSELDVLRVRFPRKRRTVSCRVRTEAGEVAARVRNVSPNGLLIAGKKPLGPIGAEVTVGFDGEWFQGRITRVEIPGDLHPDTYVYGIKSRRALRHL